MAAGIQPKGNSGASYQGHIKNGIATQAGKEKEIKWTKW